MGRAVDDDLLLGCHVSRVRHFRELCDGLRPSPDLKTPHAAWVSKVPRHGEFNGRREWDSSSGV